MKPNYRNNNMYFLQNEGPEETDTTRENRSNLSIIFQRVPTGNGQIAQPGHSQIQQTIVNINQQFIFTGDKNKANERSCLLNNQTGNIGICDTETTLSREVDELWFSILKSNIISFSLQSYNVISDILMFLILNVVHGIIFGIVLFPTHDRNNHSNEELFGGYKRIGMVMYFTSCIISKVVNSIFGTLQGGNTIIIRLLPFLHLIAEIIQENIASENPYDVVYTVLSAYALSAILTGIGFLLLVRFKYHFFLSIFPKNIYYGIIGSIGIYLIWIAIWMSIPNSESFDYSYKISFHKSNFPLLALASIWASSLAVFIGYGAKKHHVSVIALSILSMFLSFYFVVYFWSIPLGDLTKSGWIFPLDDQLTMPEYYSNFHFRFISWEAIGKAITTIFTLTFFIMLSVHVNISKLKASIDENRLNIDRELLVQGVSNLISGIFGHLQVTLEYEESTLFNRPIRLILAILIGITAYFGQLFIKYIPTIVVVTMIIYLGLRLIEEALIDSWRFSNKCEYSNIIFIIIAIMVIGFVEGIFLGVMVSYIFFLISNYRKGKVRTMMFLGNSARSTVRRHYRDQQLLKILGNVIYTRMLHGYMFYGIMKGIEDDLKEFLVDREQKLKPIKFLILNMHGVTGFEINAVQVLESIQKHLQHRKIILVICEMSYGSERIRKSLEKLSFWKDPHNDYVKDFNEYDEALEWCEDSLLGTYYAKSTFDHKKHVGIRHQAITSLLNDEIFFSHQVEDVGKHIFGNDLYLKSKNRLVNILMKVFNETTSENEIIFNLLVPYFTEEELQKDSILWSEGSTPDFMYVVETGQLSITRISTENNKSEKIERILPLTLVGDMGFLTDNLRRTNLMTITRCVLWRMDRSAYNKMVKDNPVLGNLFMKLSFQLSVKRLRHYNYDYFYNNTTKKGN